jgi:signal transduction histidine kinase
MDFGKLNSNTLDNLLEGFQLIGYDWRYLYVNDAIVKQSKCERKEDLLGLTMMEKYPGIENTGLFLTLQRCMVERIPAMLENQFIFPDGSKGRFELRIETVSEGLFILSIDITERKNAETERNTYVKGLEEMIYMTSHKVRQPVSNILSFSELLESTTISQVDLLQISQYMKQSAINLDVFTRELTLFIENLKKKTV